MGQDDDKADWIATIWFLIGMVVLVGGFIWAIIEMTHW